MFTFKTVELMRVIFSFYLVGVLLMFPVMHKCLPKNTIHDDKKIYALSLLSWGGLLIILLIGAYFILKKRIKK